MTEQETITTPPGDVISRVKQLSPQQKLGLAIGVAALIALIAGALMWGKTPEYRVLFSNLSDRDGGAIIETLQQMNIPYKFTEGGGALMIPADQVHEMRLKLAAQGLPKGGTVGFELMENQKFGITQFAEQVNYQRAMEGELARSVQSISAVASARVHLAIPKPSVFVKEQQKPSASVILTLRGGRVLDAAQVSAIVHLISSSVPDMSDKNVTVVDQDGTLLSATQEDGAMGLDAKQIKYVQQIEQKFIRRIENILSPLLGENNVRAQVTANIDFSHTEQTAEIFKPNPDPASSTVRSQQKTETLNGSGLNPNGVPGALTNQPPAPATAPIVAPAGGTQVPADAKIDNLHKESTVNYEVDRTISHTELPVGMIKRLSVAVLVNNRKVTDAKGKVSYVPLTAEEKLQIDNLVKDAVGFDAARGDSLNVQNAAFNKETVTEEEVPLWKQPDMIELAKLIAKYLIIGAVMLIVVFGIIRPAFRPLQPAKPEDKDDDAQAGMAGEDGQLSDEGQHGGGAGGEGGQGHGHTNESGDYAPPLEPYEQNLKIARQIVQQDPKIVASVIKDWVNKNE
ncbi:MAG: flagellar basal-body MS-ring/collar protein FliF [Gallionella sp.]|nr:flagellar basal-body MS-ring/collar protein FliF [Gallionella sp.]MDD4945709.1 flagellar basal-body MS-ring/collar protein FliF [Gallionella sp.]